MSDSNEDKTAIDRRRFLGTGVLGAAAALGAPLVGRLSNLLLAADHRNCEFLYLGLKAGCAGPEPKWP